jgi:hypothetical protein
LDGNIGLKHFLHVGITLFDPPNIPITTRKHKPVEMFFIDEALAPPPMRAFYSLV